MYTVVMYKDDKTIEAYIASAYNEQDAIGLAKGHSRHIYKDVYSWYAKVINWEGAREPEWGWCTKVL